MFSVLRQLWLKMCVNSVGGICILHCNQHTINCFCAISSLLFTPGAQPQVSFKRRIPLTNRVKTDAHAFDEDGLFEQRLDRIHVKFSPN